MAAVLTLTFNAALREFCERYALPAEDRWMLMQVHYRGRVPTSERDWWFIYTSIVLVMGKYVEDEHERNTGIK